MQSERNSRTIPECRENEGDDYITKGGLCEMEVRRRIAMEKGAMGGLTSIWKDRGANAGDEGETSESFGVPDCTERRLGQ